MTTPLFALADSFSAGLLFGFILGAVSTWPAYVVYTWWWERWKWRRRAELDPTLERLRRLQDEPSVDAYQAHRRAWL